MPSRVGLIVKQCTPKPVLRVYIPKPDGEERPLGIHAVEGKIVRMAIKEKSKIIEFGRCACTRAK